ELSEREKIVNEKEKNIDFLTESAEKTNREALANQRAAQRLEEKYFALYNEQENLNSLYHKAVFQRDSLECQLRDKTSECSNLKRDNENCKKELSETEKYKAEVFELQNKLSENTQKYESDISELNLKIRELQEENNITEKCYCDLYDIADYACKKLKMDVEKALKMRGENYRVSYIFGDERYR
ncbi:MAG: hypothetical protein K2J11_11075, partial [Oscillospiraceae bacterium]|nr:hypothetical protein [Oscillospiraceae bacterium]